VAKIITKCLNCGGFFHSYRSEKRKFCSKKCSGSFNNFKKSKHSDRVFFKCKECGGGFSMLKSQYKVRSKGGVKVKYCSLKCYYNSKKVTEKKCLYCDVFFKPKRKSQKFCSKKCSSGHRSVNNTPGFWFENGYKVLYAGNGNGIKEHIKIMEYHIGRKLLKNECVHHINENRLDNRIENLQLCTRGEHSKIHRLREKKMVEALYPIEIEEV
jgi:hypothetical protein